ncbi:MULTISPECIES: LuxR C-terminal-related transcriptional regulator [unclassified Microbacterium]|uniref:LuxR C-terminal-related transcriptional regulator n=1 Tax=unclassified Microbacterium TaxID=2609290 RepID=UPI000EAA516A|nr:MULTISPECIES: LuxR C-terminal-related transcriptional regulator [unclassified Microbacterium]MBT2484211.1 helix-turn-helix transcriptional regulator [Microbacterium sp. ISL-108]RKN67144.1 helix-turn-helix transcriptional regulator [Microbacterium sp. CGR2]
MSASVTGVRTDVPRAQSDLTSRPRVTAELENDSRLTVLRGACGSGKTVAMAEWARETAAAVVWLTVDSDAASSAVFARDLLRALVRHGRGTFTEEALDRPWNAVSECLQDDTGSLVIILDDAANLSRESVFDVCRVVAGSRDVRLIAATNRRSTFDSDGLDLVIDRTFIAPDTLMFDATEISRALHVDASTATRILDATDGFPAIIHGATKRAVPGSPEALLQASTAAVEDYMRIRIADSGFDSDDLASLTRMSIADAVDPGLARTLTGDADAAHLLDDLETFGFGRWSSDAAPVFVFAPFVRSLMRRELQRSYPAEVPRLRRAAVEGALRRRAPAEALRLAVEQDDLALASHVIMSGWNNLLENDGKTVVRLLGRLPLSRLKHEPLIAMILAICYIASKLRRIRGLQLLQVAISAANSRRKNLPAMERIYIWAAESAALRLIGMPERAGHVASRALALFEETPESEWDAYIDEIPLLCTHLGISLYYGGRLAEAIEWFDFAASLAASRGTRHALHGVALLSGIHARNGDMPEAQHYVDIIRQGTWDQEQLDGYRGTFYRVAEALLAVEAHDLDAAREHIRVFGPHRSTSEHWVAMAQVEAWVALHDGRAAAGLEQLESFARLRGREAGSAHARDALSRSRALLQLAVGDLNAARRTLQKDAQHDRFDTVLEQSRLALATGEASEALRMLEQTRFSPDTARQRAETAAVQSAALHRTAGAAAVRAATEALGIRLEDRELATPIALMSPDDFSFLRETLADQVTVSLPQTAALPSIAARPRLSSRELVVLRALTSGSSLQDIAADLNVSQNTLKTQLRSVYRKLGAANRAEAVQQAALHDLLSER